jgi:hypothetical protein
MTDPNGWPEKPGVPENPERVGWHWVRVDGASDPEVFRWAANKGASWNAARVEYLGVCLTPAEAAAREAAAAEAMRAKCIKAAEERADRADRIYGASEGTGAVMAAHAIANLAIPAPDALAALLRAERKKVWEEAAGIAQAASEKANQGAVEEWGCSNSESVRSRLYARAYEAKEIAAALRARAEQEGQHLTKEEQRVFHGALRRSVKIIEQQDDKT